MYYHRYNQPPTKPHLANKTANTFRNTSKLNLPYSSSSVYNNNATNNRETITISSSFSGLPTHIIEERQDVIFRKVRGILNKITPETFDKLSKELVNVGLDSPRTLRGVIYLLFDKALKDLKYSSLYAKLCQELSEKAPNFEQETGPNTFCKFLISKCEDEFERRRKATEDFDSKNELTDEEYEQKAIAKQKMLGNIKFICELGKKRLLQEEILHECIRGLLSKKKERPVQDQAQDLECLCQIMRTIGSLLDIQASRNLMNQYFERIDLFSKKSELPSRIRFMLRDVIDLRNNNWRPRPFQREDNVPQTLSKLREEAGYDPSVSSSVDKFGNTKNLIGMNDLSKLHGNKLSMLLDDEPSFTTSTDFHWGPSFLPHDQAFDAFSSSTTNVATKNTVTATTAPTTNSLIAPVLSKTSSNQQHQDLFPGPDIGRFDKPIVARNATAAKQQQHTVDMKRLDEPLAFEKRPFSDNTNVKIRNDRNDREPMMNAKNRAPINAHPPPRMQSREDPFIMNSRRFVEPRQSHAARNLNASPPMRPPIANRRNPQETAQLQNQQIAPVQQNQRFEGAKHNQADMPDNRARFNRSDYHEHEQHRQARFPNNSIAQNYRQARHERLPLNREHHHFERLGQPESDLSLNWRSGPGISGTPSNGANVNSAPSVTTQPRPFPHRINEPPPLFGSRFGGDRIQRNNATSANMSAPNQRHDDAERQRPDEVCSEKKSLVDKNFIPVRIDRERESQHLNYRNQGPNTVNNQDMRPHSNQPVVVNRFNNSRQFQAGRNTNLSPTRHGARRPSMESSLQQPAQPNVYQNSRNNSRNATIEHGLNDRRDVRRFNSTNLDKDQLQHVRLGDNETLNQQDRTPRQPHHNRNHQQESNIGMPESDKTPNWRKAQGNPQVNAVKIQAVANTAPLLPRPPTNIKNDGNFSLRPSHNLIGRGVSATPALNQQDTQSVDQSPTHGPLKDAQVSSDVSRANMKPVGRFQPESAQAVPPPSELPPVKLGAESGLLEDDLKSVQASPTRAAARDFHTNNFNSILAELSSDDESINFTRLTSKIKEFKIPKSYQPDCLVSAIKQSIVRKEKDRENVSKLLSHLVSAIFDSSSLLSAFRIIFEQMKALEVETPKVKSLVAEFLSRAVLDTLITLEDVGTVLSGGKHHPLFLLFLQKLYKNAGQAWLSEKFIASKINLMDMLPEADRTKDRLANVLKDRCLGFLDPMLTIEPDLWEQMRDRDPSAAGVYRWIRENVDPTIQATPTFAHVLISSLMKYIYGVAAEKTKMINNQETQGDDNSASQQSDKSPPSTPSLSTSDSEKDLLKKYQQVLQAILKSKDMQLATLYALQSFFHGLDFPKGSLLRWFHMLYDMNIVDDDVFFIWKEEITDEYPGKGQALFQVNTWLNWLAEAESEEEEEV